MRKLLVTGGAGFIGSNFVHFVLKKDPDARIVNLDALTYAGNLANLADLPDPSRHTFVQGDIRDTDLVVDLLRKNEVDSIVHLAAESHVDRSIVGPAPFVETNVVGTFSLLEAARFVWAELLGDPAAGKRFLHVSTDEVFGSLGPGDPPFLETTPYAPNSPYAASKAASDHLVRAYYHTYGLPVVITNCSNNYGPFQFPEKLIPLMILNALEGRSLPVYGDGGQIRDWLYVEDHCEALLTVLERGRVGETYVIGGGVQPTNLEIVTELCSILDEAVPASAHRPHRQLISFVADRPGHDWRYAMDSSKIRQDLGWEPGHSLEGGMRETVAWYLRRREWLRAVQDRPEYGDWMKSHYGDRSVTRP